MKLGREGYVFSLVVTSSLLAIVTVPAWMELLGSLLGRESGPDARVVTRLIAKAFLAPLALGMLLHWFRPQIAEKTSEWILGMATAVLAIAGVALIVLGSRRMLELGWASLLALAAMALVALAIGHWMGGPDPIDRKALAVSCATRHVGIAMLVASSVQGPQIATLVFAYMVAAALATTAYLKWGSRSKNGAVVR